MQKILIGFSFFLITITVNAQRTISSEEGFTPQVGVLVSMLNDLSNRVERTVKDLNTEEIDFLLDENANSIGTLIMHLAATEKLYQVYTFENRELNEEEEEEWNTAMSMGKEAQKKFKGKEVQEYLEVFEAVRAKTLEYLKNKDDQWLAQNTSDDNMNHYWAWFHVMEHQSSHLGQILLLKKRIPND
ncbi:DinB family protein [Ichthyenterobacterium sp. W332]|uniref:DinB family protein n=1 Tax=Microcosmobacter mediterraneus TaxID=3075607 RepID=A0ABU2YJR6_9FLAO|nr:DinB family protein [Ichthyenterobacterium sp. W332]MDT0558409.1 DinB family protein [Ichthyenterobacterium sp. W332]